MATESDLIVRAVVDRHVPEPELADYERELQFRVGDILPSAVSAGDITATAFYDEENLITDITIRGVGITTDDIEEIGGAAITVNKRYNHPQVNTSNLNPPDLESVSVLPPAMGATGGNKLTDDREN